MFKRWLSSFFKNNKNKLKQLLKMCFIMFLMSYVCFLLFSSLEYNKEYIAKEDEAKKVYKPTTAIISGNKIKKEQYEEEDNLVNIFIEYCNKGQINEAYSLLSDNCKQELYQTVEIFEEMYYKNIFKSKRKYNIQSWINKDNYHTYLIRYVNDALATGTYNKEDVFQDYITISNDGDSSKISIGNYIKTEKLDIVYNNDLFTINITGRKTYMDYIVYTIEVENKSGNTITLDPYERLDNTQIIMNNNVKYMLDWNKINYNELIVEPGKTKKMELMFNIPYGISSKPSKIKLLEVVLDYEEYSNIISYEDKLEYDNRLEIEISI